MILLVYSFIHHTKNSAAALKIQAPNSSLQTSVSPNPSSTNESAEQSLLSWTAIKFSDSIFSETTFLKTPLPDGSSQYTYASDSPSRPILIIVKNDLVIFQRIPVYNTSQATYINILGNPEYIVTGSLYWGKKAVTYIYPSRGFAFVANQQIQQVYEKMYFQPSTITQFENYDNDLEGTIQKF